MYGNYNKSLQAGDINVEEEENCLRDFLFHYNVKNLVKENTCFKSIDNPRCIDLFLTNSYRNTTTIATGLCDFHKMAITVLKTPFPKARSKVIQYRDYKKIVLRNFREELISKFENEVVVKYAEFEAIPTKPRQTCSAQN